MDLPYNTVKPDKFVRLRIMIQLPGGSNASPDRWTSSGC